MVAFITYEEAITALNLITAILKGPKDPFICESRQLMSITVDVSMRLFTYMFIFDVGDDSNYSCLPQCIG